MADSIIPFIHNYCDRWCEKCVFAKRCTVGIETFIHDKNPSGSIEDSVKILEESLKNIKTFLDTKIREMGLDPEEVEKEAEKEMPKIQQREKDSKKDPLYNISLQYSTNTHKFLKIHYYDKEISADTEITDIWDAIDWYHTMIPAKAFRVCNSLEEEESLEDSIQNDKNGTAKVLDLCIKKSMHSWHKLMEIHPEFEDECLNSLVILNKILLLNKAKSPDFEKFIRPGFDE